MRRFAPALVLLVSGCYTLDFDGDGIIDVGPVAGYETDYLSCDNGVDDDLDGRIDCADEDCLSRGFCAEYIPLTPPIGIENTFELCSNGIDDDLDGQFDCGDRDCQTIFELCCSGEFNNASCSDLIDNDGNGFADCRDFSCRNNPFVDVCEMELECDNGRDDDGDRFIDCRDSDCADHPNCQESDCSNGLDDDGDMLIDCADPSCDGTLECPVETDCTNGVDDNDNGRIDCADRGCYAHNSCLGPETTLERCRDGNDNDGNGFVDCADFACTDSARGATPEAIAHCASLSENSLAQCTDGVDNDENGFVDCADFGCTSAGRGATNAAIARCAETAETSLERCMDGIDNDGNGFIDCVDFSCSRSDDIMVLEHCRESGEGTIERCIDGIDNNRNGFVDCGDFSCRFTIIEWRIGVCTNTSECPLGQSCYRGFCLGLQSPCTESNWIDEDSDIQGNEDGSLPTDSTRAEQVAMVVRTCTDGIDNDQDGFVDCQDWECNHNPLAVDAEGDPICRFGPGRTCTAGPRAGQGCMADEDCGVSLSGACLRPGPEGSVFVCP